MTTLLWKLIEARFRSWTGMIVPDTMRPTAIRAVTTMAAQAGVQPDVLLHELEHDAGRRQHLLDAIGLGTTWFLREEAGLFALVEHLASVIPVGQTALVWSAGCSSGEEPYSLAMALTDAGLNAQILATDINRRSLRRAFDGIYPRHAVRRLPPRWRARFFESAGRDSVRVSEHIRSAVTFELHNIHTELRLPSGWHRFDAVVCRNVLIYFDRDEAIELIDRLARRCRPGGYLLLSAVERPLFWMSNVATNRDIAELVQVSPERPVARQEVRTPAPTPMSAPEPPRREVAIAGVLDPERQSKKARTDPADIDDLLARAEEAERAGRPEDALVMLEAGLAGLPLSASAHLAHGLLLKRTGRTRAAIEAFRAARFLDQHAWMAPYQLGLCLEALGEPKEAEEAYRHALAVLEAGGKAGLGRPSVGIEDLATTVVEVCRARLGGRSDD
ncbi:CheR family methyltransferase [Haliangium sp.]|uniref:CheR family methyltransferase n=1 Tax=Haliangium sp. TaxID=2663208 RepID=UPI003D0B087E